MLSLRCPATELRPKAFQAFWLFVCYQKDTRRGRSDLCAHGCGSYHVRHGQLDLEVQALLHHGLDVVVAEVPKQEEVQ